MDSNALVDHQIHAGRRLILQLSRDGFVVDAAFWVKTADEGIWFLFIASPVVEERGLAGAYRALQASIQHLQGIPMSLSDVKLVGRGNPITMDVLGVLKRHNGRLATRFEGKQLGGMTIEDAYIYPSDFLGVKAPGPMTQEELFLELFRLLSRAPGSQLPAKVTLQDGSTFDGTPFSIQSGIHQSPVVQFIAEGEQTPRILDIDDIASIQ